MNHLTNYYKNRCGQLQEQVNKLKNHLSYIMERQGLEQADGAAGGFGGGLQFAGPSDLAPGSLPNVIVAGQMDSGPASSFGGGGGPGGPSVGSPEFAGFPGSFGAGGGGQFSGAQLGQLLATGNMDAVYQYLAQFYGNNPQALAAIMASLGINAPGANAPGGVGGSVESAARRVMTAAGPAGDAAGSGVGGGGAPFSGAQLGQLLGQVGPQGQGMQNVQSYLNQYGPNGSYNAGPANVSSQSPMNRARTARRGAGRSATGR